MRTFFLLWAVACSLDEPPPPPAASAPVAPATELPGASLYHLTLPLEDQDGAAVRLDVYRGSPVIVAMFYASCPSACPMLIGDLQALEASLPVETREALKVLLVSLDPERDDPAALREALLRSNADPRRWKLVRPAPDGVREIAALLGVRYRQLADGEMNHSSILTLLDAQGVPVAKHEGLGGASEAFREAVLSGTDPNQAKTPGN